MWNNVEALVGQTLYTLDQRRPFLTRDVTAGYVSIETSTGKPRNIPRHEIEHSWQHLINNSLLSRADVRAKYSEFNPAYVVTILAQMRGVRVTVRPIVLHLGGRA